jgi:hypothetical protein
MTFGSWVKSNRPPASHNYRAIHSEAARINNYLRPGPVPACPVRTISFSRWVHALRGGIMYTTDRSVFLVSLHWVKGIVQMGGGFETPFPYCSIIKQCYPQDGPKTGDWRKVADSARRSACSDRNTAQYVRPRQRLLASPAQSLRQLLQNTRISCSSYQRAARKGRIHRTVWLFSRELYLLTGRKKWPTANCVKHLLPKSPTHWRWRGFLM